MNQPERTMSGSAPVSVSAPMPGSALAARRNLVLAVCSIAMFMGTFVTTVVAVALPVMGPALQLSYSEALWVQAVYVLAMSVFLVPVGRLADQYGLALFFLIGTSIFGVFSIACALSTSGSFLIVARCLQGAGAGFTAATAPALVTAAFPQKERGRALGLNAMAGYLGLMAGPPLGGLIVSHTSWRWIFLVNLPLVIINLVGTLCLLAPESRDKKEALAGAPLAPRQTSSGVHLDWPGVALLAFMLSALLVPLIFVPFWGWTSPVTLGLLAAAVFLFVTFVFTEDRVRDPLLDLDLLRKNRLFAAASAAAFLNYAAVHGVTTLVAVFLEVTRGYSAQTAGLYLLTQPVFMAALSPLFGKLSDRIGSRAPATAGMLLVAAGTCQLGFLSSSAPAWRVVVALAAVGIGMAAFSAPNTSAVMGSVERSQLSLASGFLGTMRTTGQGVSVALLGAIAASGLGPTGARVIFLGEEASAAAAASYGDGFRIAMLVATGLAIVGAAVSTVRGPRAQEN
ncbi:MAG: MFS transporter [Thermoleophilia bacterium]|nr:MFS transporter [Thermoleophilia bacterium]